MRQPPRAMPKMSEADCVTHLALPPTVRAGAVSVRQRARARVLFCV